MIHSHFIGRACKELRQANGFTMEDIQRQGELDRDTVRSIERGNNYQMLSFLRYCDVIKIRPSFIFAYAEDLAKI